MSDSLTCFIFRWKESASSKDLHACRKSSRSNWISGSLRVPSWERTKGGERVHSLSHEFVPGHKGSRNGCSVNLIFFCEFSSSFRRYVAHLLSHIDKYKVSLVWAPENDRHIVTMEKQRKLLNNKWLNNNAFYLEGWYGDPVSLSSSYNIQFKQRWLHCNHYAYFLSCDIHPAK